MMSPTQWHLFVINSSHLRSEPVQMFMFTLQILNGLKVVHLHLNTPTDNASLTLVTSCKLTSPTLFEPL